MTTSPDQEILCQQAQEALDKGDLHQAAELCKSLLVQFPQHAHAYYLTSCLFQATGNYRKAYDYSSIAADMDKQVVAYHMLQGDMLYILREYMQALIAYRRAEVIDPTHVSLCRGIGKCLIAMEEFDEAKDYYARAHQEKNDIQALLDEAECDIQSGQHTIAERILQECLNMLPTNAQAHYFLAIIAISNSEYERARQLLEKTVKYDKKHVSAYFYLALLQSEHANMLGAAQYFLKALEIEPTHVPSLIMLGSVFMHCGDELASEKALQHALALVPDHILAWYNLLELHVESERKAATIQQLTAIIPASKHAEALKHMRLLFNGNLPLLAPTEYIATFYNSFVDMFEPWVLATSDAPHIRAFTKEIQCLPELGKKEHLSILDLGCGTGIVTKQLASMAAIAVGVDVSPSMLKLARRRQCFDVLYDVDVVEYVRGSETIFDLVVSAGALRWMGNLQPFFQAVRGVMHHDTIVACMLDKEASTLAYSVENHGRYSHSLSYINDVANAEGLQMIHHKEWTWNIADDHIPQTRYILFFKKMTVH